MIMLNAHCHSGNGNSTEQKTQRKGPKDRHGPVIASLRPGDWMFTKSIFPDGENTGPANFCIVSSFSEEDRLAAGKAGGAT
jgi:hypothetical protein